MAEVISGDNPLQDPAQDRLGYAPFARALAQALSDMPSSKGLVVAIYGPWGSGKTTILNFVKHYLNNQPEKHRPILIDFAPWWFTGQHDLTERFLDQLAGHLKHTSGIPAGVLKLIAEFANAVSDLPIPVPFWSSITKSGAKLLSAIREARQMDVVLIKEHLQKLLAELGRQIVVVVDDIDRLTAHEIRQMFGLVKSVADFSNVVYLLAFDREIAVGALRSLQDVNKGKEYLDKIIQVSWEIPAAEQQSLDTLLIPVLDELVAGTPPDLATENDFVNMYAIVRRLLKTPRDCIRFRNALLTTYRAVRGEVNFADFLGMESLRLCTPRLYDLIRSHQDRFAGSSPSQYEQEEQRKFHSSWFDDDDIVPPSEKDALRDLVSRLFPRVRSIWGNFHHGSGFLEIWHKERRAASPEVLPAYFRLSVPTNALGRKRAMEILEQAGKGDFSQAVRLLRDERLSDGRSAVGAFLDEALILADVIPTASIVTIITALLDDSLVAERDVSYVARFPINNILRINWLIRALLKRESESERGKSLESAVSKSSGISAIAEIVDGFDNEHDEQVRKRRAEPPTLSQEICSSLRTAVLAQIRKAAEDGTLLKTPSLARVLWLWKEWGQPGETERWFQKQCESDDAIPKLVGICVIEARESSEFNPVPKLVYRLNLESLSKFIAPESLKDRLAPLLKNSTLSSRERAGLEQLERYLQSGELPED